MTRFVKLGWLAAIGLAPLAMGGCEMSCSCSGDEPRNVIDEIGDEVEDAVEEVKEAVDGDG